MATTTTMMRPAPSRDSSAQRRPELSVVPRRRRRVVGLALTMVTVVVVAMMGVTVFHTRLAERQYQLDVLERQVATERARFDVLRRDRAWMASPERLAERARELGLISGGRTEFLDVPSDIVALVAASTAGLDPEVARRASSPLDDFRTVKQVLQVEP
jgi:cell division protein FtsL